MTLTLQLFGAPTVRGDGQSWPLPPERRGQLLVLLALRRGWVGRAELAALLWPGQEARLALANLRKTLFRLDALPFAVELRSEGAAVSFDAATDVTAFEAALRERRTADALALYTGDLLAGYDDAGAGEAWSSWLGFERERHRAAWRAAVLERLGAEVDAAEAIDLSARLLAADPLDEAALREHLQWLARDGQSARARQAYQDFAARMDRDLGLAPGAELRALHERLGAKSEWAAWVEPAPQHRADDGFIGRSVELRRIAETLLQPGCRLLSLVGPGGAGKTRLARRALAELAPHHRDGALFVALEDVMTDAGFGARLAAELGVARLGKRHPIDAVVEAIGSRRLLLVLDNVEQLASQSAASIGRVIDACPELSMIVTSRVRLALASETVLPIEGLPAPDSEDRDRIESFDATRLFIAAARKVQPAIVPAAEADAIVEICRRVEGLPLAIELAAAWTRVLSCADIAAELKRGTELLRAVDAAHPPRHASIESVFEQSWRLLAPAESDALARLAVFRGGFTAEAARAVAKASLPVLGSLVDRSLLRKDGARLHLHPLVQKLAADRLGATAAAARESHARHFLRLIVASRRGTRLGEAEPLSRIDAEADNCRAAWRWAYTHDADALVDACWTLMHYCDQRGHYVEGLRLMHEAIEARARLGIAAGVADEVLAAAAAHLTYRLDRYDEAEAMASRCLPEARDRDAKVQCLKVLAVCHLRREHFDEARRHYRHVIRLSRDDPRTAAAMLDNLALVENLLGHNDESLRMSTQALTQFRAIGDHASEALCLTRLGAMNLELGRIEAAQAHLDSALALTEAHGLAGTRPFVLGNLSACAFRAGDLFLALRWGERALEATRAVHNRLVEAAMLVQLSRGAARQGDLETARSRLQQGLQLAIALGAPEVQHLGVGAFADLLNALGETDAAVGVLRLVAGHPEASARTRGEMKRQLAEFGEAPDPPPAGMAFAGLMHRIVTESDTRHAALVAELRPRG